MFLCEVGMNNTLAGLLHPQADEKMFNFSKCSTRSLSLFHLPSPLICERCRGVCAFSVALICFFLFCFGCVYSRARRERSASQTKGGKTDLGAVSPQEVCHFTTCCVSLPSAKERQNGARQPGPHTDERPLHQPGGLSHRRHVTDAARRHSSA